MIKDITQQYIIVVCLSIIQMSVSQKDNCVETEQIRHGVQYISRQKQPTMFEILSWQHNPLDNKDWLKKMQPDYKEAKFTEPQIYEKPKKEMITNIRIDQPIISPTKNLKGHSIKHDLYYYGSDKAIENKKDQGLQLKKEGANEKLSKTKEIKRLDQFKEQEKRQIQIRKQNIKKFKYYTRQLPDSAFTTYFGKPAFANYGYSSDQKSITKHKSHSIMPHAGKNQPDTVQSQPGALKKANVVNLESHVPRKPNELVVDSTCKVNVNEYYNVEIVKPDLVNEVRFSNHDRSPLFKSKTPSHKDLNYLPKRKYAPPLQIKKNNKKKKQPRAKTEEKDDGLAFMTRRQKFIKDLDEKKKVHNRIAYKVTECYPLDWDFETQANSTGRDDRWKEVRAAGVTSEHYLKAQSRLLE